MSAVRLLISEGGVSFIHGGDRDRIGGFETAELELLFEVIVGDETVALREVGFEKHNLDFCCKGKRTLADACKSENIDLEKIISDLEKISTDENGTEKPNFEKLSPVALVDHILQKHHTFVKYMMPVLNEHLQKVSNKHGERHTVLSQIAALFEELKSELTQHMAKEENILFPYIKRMEHLKKENIFQAMGFVENPIRVMMHEHEQAGEIMRKINQLTNHYVPPADACTTYRLCFSELEEFERDLHQHVHLENNILFPKAVDLENSLAGI